MKTPKHKTSITLTPHAVALLQQLATQAGLSISAYLETLIRATAKAEGVGLPPS